MDQSTNKQLYAEIGKLLYAVADIDHVIRPEEKQVLLRLVRNELVPAERLTDEFGTDTTWYAEIEFEFLDEQIADSETVFQSFIDFVDEHRNAIDPRLRKACLVLAEKLAAAYHGVNRKEKALLDTLKRKLQ